MYGYALCIYIPTGSTQPPYTHNDIIYIYITFVEFFTLDLRRRERDVHSGRSENVGGRANQQHDRTHT